MTQRQFAERLGISFDTFKGWIRFERVPETSMAYSLAIALGVTLNYLLGGKERDIARARLNELEARRAAGKMVKLAEKILKEAKKARPL